MTRMLANRCAMVALAAWVGVACTPSEDPPSRLRVSNVRISNAVLGYTEEADGSLTERKDPNIQTLYMDLHARGLGAWSARCRYVLLAESGARLKEGHFELSGADGDITNLSAPFTFRADKLPDAPSRAEVDCSTS